jgi:uncharacterized protein YdhG (YjbR/CyaY superfamily)
MISKATNVQAYIEEAQPERRPALEKLRDLCRRELRGYEEAMEYGMPAYKRNGVVEVAFASQKQHIALYVLKKEVMDEFRGALSAAKIGKGCIRFSRPARIDFDVIRRLLRRNVESKAAAC